MNTPFDTLRVQDDGPVRTLTLHRPALRNAMSLAMVDELRQGLDQALHAGTRVLVLRGAGGHFCAGADLKDLAGARTADDVAAVNARFGALCGAFADAPLALVAVLEGSVMGGGFGLACVADVALAADDVVFRLPETSLGLLPAQIAPFLVERLGVSEARRLAVTGARLDATAALALRLVHEVHAADALDAALARVLADILRCAPQAVAATKALIARARFVAPAALVHEAAAAFAAAALGAEGIEGRAAFVDKRLPSWAVRA